MLSQNPTPPRPARWKPPWAIAIAVAVVATLVAGLVMAANAGIQAGGYAIIFALIFAPFLVAACIELILAIVFVFTGGRALFYVVAAGALPVAYLAGVTISGGLSDLMATWIDLFTVHG